MKQSFDVKFDEGGVMAALDKLGEGLKSHVRPAAQAGAQVFYDEVRRNVAEIGKVTGNLASSIYQVYSKDNSSEEQATYHISWNAKKAPHGHLVEFGHLQTRKVYVGSDGNWYTSKEKWPFPVWVAPKSFIRSAYDAMQLAAMKAVKEKFEQEAEKTIEGLKA